LGGKAIDVKENQNQTKLGLIICIFDYAIQFLEYLLEYQADGWGYHNGQSEYQVLALCELGSAFVDGRSN